MNRKKPELLLPAKDIESLRIAIHYGADAVYLGGKAFGLRVGAANFELSDIKEAVDFAHNLGKKIYVTANIIATNPDIENAPEFFKALKEIGPDGVLVADPGMYRVLKSVWPDCNIHISTQAGNSNYETLLFWYELGIRRVVCERLLTLSDIRLIREKIPEDMELEAFVHGAMCISYSGRCLLSAALTGRDANKGACTHPCRWKYSLVEESRPGEYFPITEDEGGTYIMNSKDLWMIDRIPELVEAGVDSLKIEGRMKSPLYAASVACAYRRAIDDYFKDPELYHKNIEDYKRLCLETTHRPYSHGFYYGDKQAEAIVSDESSYINEYTYLGYVEDIDREGYVKIHQKNKFLKGDVIQLMNGDGINLKTTVLDIKDAYGNSVDSAPHPKQELYLKLSEACKIFDILKVRENAYG